MNDRDELADIIQDAREYIPGSHGEDYVNPYRAADAILAAGYRKPRQITTVEELDFVGREAVLRDDNGQLFEQNWMLATPDDMWWENLSERGNTKQSPALPATVLWEPLP